MTTPVKKTSLFPSVFNDFFDAERFFNPPFSELGFRPSVPSVNIRENVKEYKIELAAPGMNKKDFKVKVDDHLLTISAIKEEEKNEKDTNFTRREFSCNSFSRSFRLPEGTKTDAIEGKYEDGVLKLNIPKMEEDLKSISKEIELS